MSTGRITINQFNNGLINAPLEARNDWQYYPYSCRQLKNFISDVYGGVKNRPGSIFAHRTKSSGKAGFIPFSLSNNNAFELEFGDKYIRFYKNHAAVSETLYNWSSQSHCLFGSTSSVSMDKLDPNKSFGSEDEGDCNYLIMNGGLYYVRSEEVGGVTTYLKDRVGSSDNWQAVSGYYDSTHYAYGIKCGNIYKLEGTTVTRLNVSDVKFNKISGVGSTLSTMYAYAVSSTGYLYQIYNLTATKITALSGLTNIKTYEGVAVASTNNKIYAFIANGSYSIIGYAAVSKLAGIYASGKYGYFINTSGKLYYYNYGGAGEIGTATNWKDVKGFSDGSSIYAYAINTDGELYQLSGATATQVGSSTNWENISGRSDGANYYCWGINSGLLYYINGITATAISGTSDNGISALYGAGSILMPMLFVNKIYYTKDETPSAGDDLYVFSDNEAVTDGTVTSVNASGIMIGSEQYYQTSGLNSSMPYEITTDYDIADLFDSNGVFQIDYQQSADVIYLAHDKYPLKKLSHYGDSDWTISDCKLTGGPWRTMNTDKTLVLSPSANSGTITITARKGGGAYPSFWANNFKEGLLIRLNMQFDNGVDIWYAGRGSITSGDVLESDGKFYQATSSGTCGTITPTHTEGSVSDGGVMWKYIHSGYAVGTLVSYTEGDACCTASFTGDIIPADIMNNATYKWELGLIGADDIYPSSVTFHKDRLTLGINASSGPAVITSCSSDYENFEDMSFGEVLATNSINLPINTNNNTINWLISQDNLYVGTEGGIVPVYAMSSSEAFGPDNVTYAETSSPEGTCRIKPVKLGGELIYLDNRRRNIYKISYDAITEQYIPSCLSLTADSLLEVGVISWTLQYNPNKIIWNVMSDGTIIGFTYDKVQGVQSYHRHETDGHYEFVSSIISPDGSSDDLYSIVRRSINSSDVRYIEYSQKRFPSDASSYSLLSDKLTYLRKTGIFSDCSSEYDSSASEFNGLDYLEGKEVSILADGTYYSGTIHKGCIEIDVASAITKIGLAYESILEPEPRASDSEFYAHRTSEIQIQTYRSVALECGGSADKLKEYDICPDSELSLYSGVKVISWNSDTVSPKLNAEDLVNSGGNRIIIKNSMPYPLHITAISVKLDITAI